MLVGAKVIFGAPQIFPWYCVICSHSDIGLCSLVGAQKRESEAVKLISVKAGLLDLSQSWNVLSSKVNTLSKAQKVGTVVTMSTSCGYYGNMLSSGFGVTDPRCTST